MGRRSNCFVFAWWYYLVRKRSRGYILMRKSRHIAGWHWLWSDGKHVVSYEPHNPKGVPMAIWDKIYYHGFVKRSRWHHDP